MVNLAEGMFSLIVACNEGNQPFEEWVSFPEQATIPVQPSAGLLIVESPEQAALHGMTFRIVMGDSKHEVMHAKH